LNGYFIGTCYDGHTIMKELRPYSYNDGIQKYEKHELICEIIKRYDTEEFEDESTCLGKEILVYQDSINQYLPEYLVNFRYLERMAGLYGFKLLSSEECKQLKIPASEGMFKTLFRLMENNHNNSSEYASALNMTDSERFVSFLNRYFIFKKVRDINAKTVFESFVQPFEQDETLLFEPQEQEHSPVQQVKPLHRKIILTASPEEGRASPPKKSIRKIIPEGQEGPKTKKKKNVVFNILPPKETLVDVFERKKKEREERDQPPPPPVVEPIVEPPKPVVEPVVEPPKPIVKPVVEPIVEPPKPIVKPVVEPPKPIVEPIVEPPKPIVEQVVEPPKPATKKKSVIKFNFTKKAPTEKPP